MSWQWLILLIFTSLSTYRLTRLVVEDDFPLVRIPREWVVGEKTPLVWDEQGMKWTGGEYVKHKGRWYFWFGELITCPWCASGWISLGWIVLVAQSDKSGTFSEWLLLWISTWALGSITAAKV